MADRTDHIRHLGGRNFVRAGDLVRVSVPGHRGFKARFQWAEECPSGVVYAVLELDGKKAQRWRFVRPERVRRTARTRDPAKR